MARIHELARKSLDERWIPIRDAETLVEASDIIARTSCAFCIRKDEFYLEHAFENTCIYVKCPLASNSGLGNTLRHCCHGQFSLFREAINCSNIDKAKDAAADICNQLQALLDAPDYEW